MKISWWLKCFLLPLSSVVCKECEGPRHALEFEQKVIRGKGYEKSMPPNFASKADPVDVQVQFYFASFDGVDEQHESVSVTGYLRTWWMDPRLAFATNSTDSCVEALTVPGDMPWIPKLHIYNSIKLTFEKDGALTTVHSNGTIFHSVAVHGSLKCAMQFHRMPYDSHGCFIKLGCYSETTRSIRIRPRHGSPEKYMNSTGVAVVGDRMYSPTWFIEGEQQILNPGIRTAHYWPDLGGYTDIIFLPFQFSRRPGYLTRMVLVPSWLFLIVSYTGFFIDPKAAPARAAVALLPILIMRSLQGFVFSKIPEVATCVWLIDYLLSSMIMCCYAAVHLAIVQLILNWEDKADKNQDRLRKVEQTARKLIKESNDKEKLVALLLDDYVPKKMGDGTLVSYMANQESEPKRERGLSMSEWSRTSSTKHTATSPMQSWPQSPRTADESTMDPLLEEDPAAIGIKTEEHFALNVRRNTAYSPINKKQTTEGDVEVIRYLLNLWHEEVPEPTATPEMIRKVMTRFNIYMTTNDAASIMCMFLRDKGFDTPGDVSEVRIIFSLFMELLLDIEKYRVRVKPLPWVLTPFSQAAPLSTRLDVGLQIAFPLCVVLHAGVFFSLVGAYPQNPEVGLVADLKSIMLWQ